MSDFFTRAHFPAGNEVHLVVVLLWLVQIPTFSPSLSPGGFPCKVKSALFGRVHGDGSCPKEWEIGLKSKTKKTKQGS